MTSNMTLGRPGNTRQETAAVAPPEAPARRLRLASPPVPAYLKETYTWAYLDPRMVRLLDHNWVVSLILWGWRVRLEATAFAEIQPGQKVLQPACVYGDFSNALARHVGPQGSLVVTDVAPVQVENCRRKLHGVARAAVYRADAADPPGGGPFDVTCSFFLLHEVPDGYKRRVIDSLLGSVGPGGRVVFIDYHRPEWWHPLKGVMSLVFDFLEPFAKTLWRHEIADLAGDAHGFRWSKQTYFGGLYQKVVAIREP